MNEKKERSICKLLESQINYINNQITSPGDYSGVRSHMLQLELSQEIEALTGMFKNPSTFDQNFKDRCAFRQIDSESTIPFKVMPKSPTNDLYRKIANLVFDPQTLEDLLHVVWPGIEKRVEINFAGEHRELMQKQPILNLIPLQNNIQPKALAHFVISDNLILDTRDIAHYSLTQHSELFDLLTRDYPKLSKELYQHNSSFQELLQDILILNNKGSTPKNEIEQLIKGLILGGKKMPGHGLAGTSAVEAIALFFRYFNALSPSVKEQLGMLEADNITLGYILHIKIPMGDCVKIIANQLTRILEKNNNQPLLISSPILSLEDLNELKNKYQDVTLNTKKDNLINLVFPTKLTEKTICVITVNTSEELINLLLTFPSHFYKSLLSSVTLDIPTKYLSDIADLIKKGFFNEQKQDLAKAIFSNYVNSLFWAISTNDPFILEEALKSLSLDQRKIAITTDTDKYGNTALHQAAANPQFLKILLDQLPLDKQLKAIKKLNVNGSSVLFKGAKNYDSLKLMLDLYQKEQSMEVIYEINKNNYTLIHKAASNPHSLKKILGFYRKDELLDAVRYVNNFGRTALHSSIGDSRCLQMILDIYPEDQILDAINKTDNTGTTVLHLAAVNPQSLRTLLDFYTPEELLNTVKAVNENGTTVLHFAGDNIESLKMVLEIYPCDERLDALKLEDNNGLSVLNYAVNYPGYYTMMLQLLPDHSKLELMKLTTDIGGMTMLYIASRDLNTFKTIIKSLPEHIIMEAVKLPNKDNVTVLDEGVSNLDIFKVILNYLPETQRISFLNLRVAAQTICSLLIANPIKFLSTDEGFGDSFVPVYIEIYKVLSEQKSINSNAYSFYQNKTTAEQLLQLLGKCESTDEINTRLLEHITTHPDTIISKKIVTILEKFDFKISESLSENQTILI